MSRKKRNAIRKEVYVVMENKKSSWDLIFKLIIALVSAAAGVLGGSAMNVTSMLH